jgi:hypothetical protein
VNADEEILHLGGPRHARRGLRWTLAVAAVVVVLAGGVVAWRTLSDGGSGPTPAAVVPTAASSLVPSVSAAVGMLSDNGNRCSAEQGKRLQLGIEITNGYQIPVLITGARIDVPLGALRRELTTFTPCRAGATATSPQVLDAGMSLWVSAIFDVEVACPAFAPVQFAIDYIAGSRRLTTVPSGFSDLGTVSYSGCATATTSAS